MTNGLHFIRANSVVKINNGESIKIESSSWIPGDNTRPILSHPNHGNYIIVKDLIDTQSRGWNVNMLSSLFSQEDVIRIRSIRLNLNHSDKLI